jgi:hypothetical protein
MASCEQQLAAQTICDLGSLVLISLPAVIDSFQGNLQAYRNPSEMEIMINE